MKNDYYIVSKEKDYYIVSNVEGYLVVMYGGTSVMWMDIQQYESNDLYGVYLLMKNSKF